jgi:tetratricopeptide (TPR) repeat protein
MAEEKKNFLQLWIDWFSSLRETAGKLVNDVGWSLAVVIVLAIAGGLLWWKWKDIKERPGIESLLGWFKRKPIPRAPADRLTIAVAQLANDKDREHETLLVDELGHFEGVETRSIGRTVSSESLEKEKAEKKARAVLKQMGADVLIWGSVISLGGRSAMRLYWTPSREISGAKQSGKYQPPTETIALPVEFWSDLKQILGLLTRNRLAELTFGQEGHYVADRLAPLIVQVRALAESKEGVWEPETLAGVRFGLATALGHYGEQSGKNEPLTESAELYRKVLDQWTRARVPLDWAATQNNLGIVLQTLGAREHGTGKLEEAVGTFYEALKGYSREQQPLEWAKIKMNLGNTLAMLGERETGTQRLEQAVTAYHEVLEVCACKLEPSEWAKTKMNLGNTLAMLGELETGTQRLEEAVATYREALKEDTHERRPLERAKTQANLAGALSQIGARTRETSHLKEAIDLCRDALRECKHLPVEWAKTQNKLGEALAFMGEMEMGTAMLDRAFTAHREALKVWTRESFPLQWARTKENLGRVHFSYYRITDDPSCLDNAFNAVRNAIEEFRNVKAPTDLTRAEELLGQIQASTQKQGE